MKNENFSTVLTITSPSYAGEHAGKYISAALLSASTLDKNLITVYPNIKYKQVITKFSADSLLADASCDFTPAGNVVLTEVTLVPKELQVNLNLCKQDFIDSWEAVSMGYSAFDNIPANFNDYLISYVGGKISEATESSLWVGSGATNGQFGGIIPALLGDVTTIVKSGATITASNVIDILDIVYNAIPDTIFGKEDLRIFVSQKVAKAYTKALATANYLTLNTVDEKPLNYQGTKIEVVNGIVGDYIVAAQISNLFFGTGLLSDFNQVKVLDMSDIDGSQNWRVIFRFTAGTAVGIPSEVVLYRLA